MKKANFLFCLIFTIITTTSCVTDFDLFDVSSDIKIDESLVLPVAEGNISVDDILKTIGLPKFIDTTNSIISYIETYNFTYSYPQLDIADTIRPFHKQLFLTPVPVVLSSSAPVEFPPIDATVVLNINRDITDEHVDSILVKSALMSMTLEVSPDLMSIPASDISVEFVFADEVVRFDDAVNKIFQPVDYGVPANIQLGKFTIALNSSQVIPIKILVKLNTHGNNVVLTPESYLMLKMKFLDVDLSRVYGLYFLHLENEGTFNMDFKFDKILPNTILKLANPKLDLKVKSNVGMNFDLNIDHLKVYHSDNPSNVYEAQFINPATGAKSKSYNDTFIGPLMYGDWVTKEFSQFNNENGEFDKLFGKSPLPNRLDYKVSMHTKSSRLSNFISADNKTDIDLNVILPFQLKEDSYFTFRDTIKNINVGTVLDNLDSAILVLKVKNGFPLRAKYRMTFWKSDLANDTVPAIGGTINTVVDNTQLGNMTSQYILTSPTVNSSGFVTEIKPQNILIMLNKTQIQALKSTKFIVFNLTLNGDEKNVGGVINTNPISFTTKNSFGVKLGLYLKANAVVNLMSTINN